MKTLPAALICAAAAMALCQLFKFIYYSARDRKIGLPYLSTTGGFPSAHSAFVCALTLSVGMRNGFASDIFGISTVFSLLVMYDAVRLRREVQRHAVLLNRLAEKQKLDGDRKAERDGRTLSSAGHRRDVHRSDCFVSSEPFCFLVDGITGYLVRIYFNPDR